MKHTRMEDKALETAGDIKPMTAKEWAQIRDTPRQQRTLPQRRALLADTLKRAAEEFEQRERNNDLYRYYLKEGNRTEARYHAPSGLQDKTSCLRYRLTEAWKALRDFDRSPLAQNVSTESKTWAKRNRFWQAMDAERAIQKNGGKVRYRRKRTRRDEIYDRIILRANRAEQPAKPEPQMEFSL